MAEGYICHLSVAFTDVERNAPRLGHLVSDFALKAVATDIAAQIGRRALKRKWRRGGTEKDSAVDGASCDC